MPSDMDNFDANAIRLPVTILTGFLGSGKTTLLNRVLRERHGHRIAVIENEFGAAGIDSEILLQEHGEQIVEMNNGCICCTVRGDLVRILGELSAKRKAGGINFNRVIIETTGLADPAPVAQTFFAEPGVAQNYMLDGVVTVVDAKHAPQQLDAHRIVQEQIGFADRILLSKTDLVGRQDADALIERLRRINPRAPVSQTSFGSTDIAGMLDIRGFDLGTMLEVAPHFLQDVAHQHDDAVKSFVYRTDQPFDLEKLESFLGQLLEIYGADMLRYKGVLYIEGNLRRVIFQGVHLVMGSGDGRLWDKDEKRASVMVFIGRKLPQARFEQGLAQCVVGATRDPASVLRL
jgi:G3E family GTPase